MSDFASRLVARSVGPVGLRPAARPRFAAGGVAEVAVETPAAIPAAPPAATAPPRGPAPAVQSTPAELPSRRPSDPTPARPADPLVEVVATLPAREARPAVATADRVVVERHTAEVRAHERTVQERSRTVERERELTRVVAPAEPVVRVTIGRVEVRAERPSEPSRKRVQPAAPMTSLSDYAPGTRR